MKNKSKKERPTKEPNTGEKIPIEWGETHQERIIESSRRSASARHTCKGRQCITAFEKL